MTDHATERGELLARLEHRCLYAGRWEVEGYSVSRRGRGVYATWYVGEWGDSSTPFHSFTDALRWIADAVEARP